MKTREIKDAVEKHLQAIGIAQNGFTWLPLQAQLVIFVGNELRIIKLRSGIPRRALAFQLGYITGLAEVRRTPGAIFDSSAAAGLGN